MGRAGTPENRTDKIISYSYLKEQLGIMAEFYNSAIGYNDRQAELLYKRLSLLTERELANAFEAIRNTHEKFPTPVYILMHTRPAEMDASARKKAIIIRENGLCPFCQSTGMVIVQDHTDMERPGREVTMRCGECKVAELTGVLKSITAWKKDMQADLEPTIIAKSWNDSPSKGRLDEILAMPATERQELITREPWIKWCLGFYGIEKNRLRPR
jgi:hypothetical protein